jgi:hypothetical protein
LTFSVLVFALLYSERQALGHTARLAGAPGFAGAPPIRDASLALRVRRFTPAPGLVAALHLHQTRGDSRRTVSAELKRKGQPGSEVARFLGHSERVNQGSYADGTTVPRGVLAASALALTSA